MSPTRKILLLLSVLIALSLSITGVNANPFVSGESQPGNGDSPTKQSVLYSSPFRVLRDNALYRSLVGFQRSFNQTFTRSISDYREHKDLSLLFYVCFIAIGYGFVHALMPGHGKNIIFGWVVSSGKKFKKVAVTAALSMAMHVFTAIVLVYSIWLVFGGRISSQSAVFTRYFSYLAFGILLLIALKQLVWVFLPRNRFSGVSHTHSHGLEIVDGDTSWKECLITASSIGLIPCPVSTIMIVFMISRGFHLEGLLTGLFFALGMAGTMLTFATITWFLRSFLIGNQKSGFAKSATVSLSVFGSLLLVFAALLIIAPYM